MATRIRYEKFEDPTGKYDLISVRNFHSPRSDAMYIVYIDTKTVTYIVKNMFSGRKYSLENEKRDPETGEFIKLELSNVHVLKRHVKERLEKLGVEFDSEIRDNSTRVKGVNCGYARGDALENSEG